MNSRGVTAVIPTKNRYFSTLPLTIMSVASQTYPVEKVLIIDDGEQKDLREESLYRCMLRTLDAKGILWEVAFGKREGQAKSHQMSIERAKTEWIWRLDDDNWAEPTCLEHLMKTALGYEDGPVGAVGGCVLDPNNYLARLPIIASNKIEDWFLCLNMQWFPHDFISEVDHLYSTFVYRKAASSHGYPMNLSPVSHTEETQFTYGIKLQGYKILINPAAVTWHFRAPSGGIRDYKDVQMWDHDSVLFAKKIQEWGVKPKKFKLIVLDNGLGDHFMFLRKFGIIRERYPDHEFVIACCYPEVFEDLKNVKIISIAEAQILKNGYLDEFNLYKFCWDRRWEGKHISEAYLELYK